MLKKILGAGLGLLSLSAFAAEKASPAGAPAATNEIRVSLEGPASEATAWLRVGTNPAGVAVRLVWADGSNTLLRFQAANTVSSRRFKEGGKNVTVPVTLTNACVEVAPLRLKLQVCPNPDGYPAARREELFLGWSNQPPASEWRFPVAIRSDAAGAEYWFDGRYAGRADRELPLKEVVFQPGPGAEAGDARLGTPVPGLALPRYLPLDLSRVARPDALAKVGTDLPATYFVTSGVPFRPVGGSNTLDVGQAKELTGGGMEVDPYLARTAFDAMPESLLVSVPLAQYTRAWVLCAAEDNPAKDPVLTARLTRFSTDGRGDAIADTTVWLPKEGGAAPGFAPAGSMTYSTTGGLKRVRLWKVGIPLKSGAIQDLIFFKTNESYNAGRLTDRRYLDFELLGKLGTPLPQGDQSHKPDRQSVSAVRVFGITLERTPVEMEVRQTQVGNVFEGAEKPEIQVVLRPLEAGTFTLTWTVRDVDGKTVGEESKKLKLKAGGEQVVTIPLSQKELGWYGLTLALEDAASRRLVEHPTSFALMAADTRRAGYESPYGTWWFGTAHRGTDDKAIGGPLLLKAGLRHTNFGWHKLTEADMAPWKVGAFQVPWLFRVGTGDVAAASAKYEQAVREYLVKFPHCDEADIFHESYSGDTIPAELRDGKPAAMSAEQEKGAENRYAAASAATRVLREKFPQVKTVFGNSNPGASLVAEFFRKGYPRADIDYLGIEAAGQTFLPEKLTEYGTQAAWIIRETARKMGHEIPVTCCYEWLYRNDRVLGHQQTAEWYVRDALIAHAYRFTHISMALLYDAGNCYYNSLWGGAGLCARYPLLNPKPAYVAYANLTRVLDDVRLIRRVPAGSLSLYALEFSRDAGRIYVLWTPRGLCRATLQFERDQKVTVVDLYGRRRVVSTKKRELSLEAGTAAQYLLAEAPVVSIAAGARSFPGQNPEGWSVANPMNRGDEWELVSGKDDRLECPTNPCLPLRTAGTFTLKEADDAEKGRCLELELKPGAKVPDIVTEYTVLKLKTPVLLQGQPTTLGVWVKGNSGWGRIMWTFEDAAGKSWLSCGTPGWGCDILDWPGEISVNFDGWCLLQFPISRNSPVMSNSPGGVEGQWVVKNGSDKKVVYPVKVTGLAVEMAGRALDLTEMTPVTPVLRFRDLGAL